MIIPTITYHPLFLQTQVPTPINSSKPLPSTLKTLAQQMLVPLLFYGRTVDPTILVSLSSITSQQAKPTMKTLTNLKSLLDYLQTHLN